MILRNASKSVPLLLSDIPQPEPYPSGQVARIDDFNWRLHPVPINPEGPTDLRLFVNVLPDARTDDINGRHLWKVGIYGSKYKGGGEPYEERLGYDPQVSKALRPGPNCIKAV